MPDLDLAALKALAEKATKGPRSARPNPGWTPCDTDTYEVVTVDGIEVCGWEVDTRGGVLTGSDDAAFIAACDPDTILALIAEIEHLRASVNCDSCGYHDEVWNQVVEGEPWVLVGCGCILDNPNHECHELGCKDWCRGGKP